MGARAAKAAKMAPRPASGPLRPMVHGQTQKYNLKVKAGRGFTLAELKAAGISHKVAPTVGIAVDRRRVNKCQESIDANVARLQEYMSRLVVFPKHPTKGLKKGETAPTTELVALTAEQKSFEANAEIKRLRAALRK